VLHRDHPLSEDSSALLDSLAPRQRLAAMLAMRWLFQFLDNDPGWRTRYTATLREVDPSPDEMDDLRREAARLINTAGEGYDPARRIKPRRERRKVEA
jgi:hypothetical protein